MNRTKWEAAVRQFYPYVQFTYEDGSGRTYGNAGDVTAHIGPDMQSDVVGVWCRHGHWDISGTNRVVQQVPRMTVLAENFRWQVDSAVAQINWPWNSELTTNELAVVRNALSWIPILRETIGCMEEALRQERAAR